MFKSSALQQKLINSIKLKNADTIDYCFKFYPTNQINDLWTIAGGSIFHLAVKTRDIEVLRRILKHNPPFDMKNSDGQTPYEVANNYMHAPTKEEERNNDAIKKLLKETEQANQMITLDSSIKSTSSEDELLQSTCRIC